MLPTDTECDSQREDGAHIPDATVFPGKLRIPSKMLN